MAKLWQFSQGHPRPAFSEKVKRGDRGKLLKNRPKSSRRLKDAKAPWHKWYYPLIYIHLNCKDWKRFWPKQRLLNCPNGQVMAIFACHPKAAFCEKVQRGDQGKFFKNRPKSSPRLKGLKARRRKWHYSLISMYLNCKDWTRMWPKRRLQKCPNGRVIAIFARSPKTLIF